MCFQSYMTVHVNRNFPLCGIILYYKIKQRTMEGFSTNELIELNLLSCHVEECHHGQIFQYQFHIPYI